MGHDSADYFALEINGSNQRRPQPLGARQLCARHVSGIMFVVDNVTLSLSDRQLARAAGQPVRLERLVPAHPQSLAVNTCQKVGIHIGQVEAEAMVVHQLLDLSRELPVDAPWGGIR